MIGDEDQPPRCSVEFFLNYPRLSDEKRGPSAALARGAKGMIKLERRVRVAGLFDFTDIFKTKHDEVDI